MAITRKLDITQGWMNASGMFGWYLPTVNVLPVPPVAFITSPVSLHPRKPAANRCAIPFAGGILIHSGWPNPGLRHVIQKYSPVWARTKIPVWVHLLAEGPENVRKMVMTCEEVEAIQAIELGIPAGLSQDEIKALVSSSQGELPVILQVPLDRAQEEWISDLEKCGADAISIGPPRGRLALADGTYVSGRLYGAGLYPLVLNAMNSLAYQKLPVIASGGIFNRSQIDETYQLGAAAVQLDLVLWRGRLKEPIESV